MDGEYLEIKIILEIKDAVIKRETAAINDLLARGFRRQTYPSRQLLGQGPQTFWRAFYGVDGPSTLVYGIIDLQLWGMRRI